MQRQERAITEVAAIDAVIRSCQVCRLGLSRDNQPYVVPLSFGYDGECIYLHTAFAGRKIEFWEANPEVCVEFDNDVKLVTHEAIACKWTTDYRSVICYGRISEICEYQAKRDALNQIMKQYSGKSWEYQDGQLDHVRIWGIAIRERYGKSSYR